MRGLGYNNLLFMAAELLLLQSHPDQVPLLLIEEPEAHLHPQHQTLFMQVLELRSAPVAEGRSGQQVQILLSTHSPQLAASADLESLVMVLGQAAYPLDKAHTKLASEDYAFLRRFLDATKANLFFARGVMIVEGDAENILLPAVAKKIGKSFGKHGVSVVNVGHRGLFRYSRIFQRSSDENLPIPVALIPDRDIPPDAAKELVGDRPTEEAWKAEEKTAYEQKLRKDEGGVVRAFPSEQWTLEFDLARQPGLAALVHQAVQVAKGAAGKIASEIAEEARKVIEALQADEANSADSIAVQIFEPVHKKQVSKTEVAEQLAALIGKHPDNAAEFRAKLPAYLVTAIDYVTGTEEVATEGEAAGAASAEAAAK
jgi:putative ATP-dependent endonuclease of the OLD family